jgi:hypothetical protein
MTQINLFSQSEYDLENTSLYCIVVLWFRGCSSDSKSPQVAKVTVG